MVAAAGTTATAQDQVIFKFDDEAHVSLSLLHDKRAVNYQSKIILIL